jgi:hypothetical protein
MLSVNPSDSFLRRLEDLAASGATQSSAEAKRNAKILREALAARAAACADMCDDTDPVPLPGEVPRVWKHRVLPMALVRVAAALAGMETKAFLAEAGGGSSFVLAPQEKPANPRRREMRARLRRIDAAVDTAMYNEMLTKGDSAPTPMGGKGSGMGSMTIDATSAGGKGRVVLGGAMRDAQRGAVERAQPETLKVVMKDVGLGIDMRLMSLAGGIVGYYLCYSRSLPKEQCFIGAAVGVVAMLFVDALLLIIRMSREDGKTKLPWSHDPPEKSPMPARKPMPKKGAIASDPPKALKAD